MTPNQPSLGGLNIDSMLENLSTKPQGNLPIPSIPTVTSIGEGLPIVSPLGTTVSIDTISKPTSPLVSESSIPTKLSHLSGGMKTLFSVLATTLLIIVGIFVVSKQYPVETQTFTNKLFGVVSAVVTTTTNNTQPDAIVVSNTIDTGTDIHDAAPDNYITETPLADALAASQDTITQDTTTDQTLDTIADTLTMSGDSISSGTHDNEHIPQSLSGDITLPSLDTSMTHDQLQTKLLTLSQSAEESITNLIGNSDIKTAKMRAVYKKSQALITQLSDHTFVPDTVFIDQITQLQSLYDSVSTH